jgi:hypothetical protein
MCDRKRDYPSSTLYERTRITREIRVDGSWVQRYGHYAFIAISPSKFVRKQDVALQKSRMNDVWYRERGHGALTNLLWPYSLVVPSFFRAASDSSP